MRIAVIDCGTNTFNLLVADAQPASWQVVFQSKLPVKLGAGGFEEGVILPARFVRGLDALMCHKENIRNFSCEKVFAFATSAIREAGNGKDFILKSRELAGIEIQVIDGEREAELIYEGVRQTVELGKDLSLIMDIGGGSTEFIIADSEKIHWKKSFLLGVSRLSDLVKPEDKMSSTDLRYLEDLLDRELAPLAEALKKFDVKQLIGSSGSFDTLLMLHIHHVKGNPSDLKLSNEIPMNGLNSIHKWLLNSTYEDRVKHPVIPSIRAEYMPLASCLVKYVLAIQKFQKLIHSSYSLKEGAMVEMLRQIEWPKDFEKTNEMPGDSPEA